MGRGVGDDICFLVTSSSKENRSLQVNIQRVGDSVTLHLNKKSSLLRKMS